METRYAFVEKLPGLIYGPLHSHPGDLFVAITRIYAAQELCGVPRPQGKIRDTLKTAPRQDRHEPGNDRHGDIRMRAALAKVEEVVVVEEELRADVVRTGFNLLLEIAQLAHAVGRIWMPFGKAGHANAETTCVRMPATAVELFNMANQIDRVRKIPGVALLRAPVSWGIAAEGH